MCLILFAYRTHPRYPLIVAANRDEFTNRPTRAAAFWGTDPEILAGKDLQAGGTWLGVQKSGVGAFSAITNYRDPDSDIIGLPSRGKLVTEFLLSSNSAGAYLSQIADADKRHNGYNLFTYRNGELAYYSNRSSAPPRLLSPGVYGVSNHLLDTPWPKVSSGRKRLDELVHGGNIDTDDLVQLLADRRRTRDQDLPETGVPLDTERSLSSMFIRMKGYCTRSSTAVLFARDGTIRFKEHSFDEEGTQTGAASFEW